MELAARILGPDDAPAVAALFDSSARRLPQHPGLAGAVSGDGALRQAGVFRGDSLVMAASFTERRGRAGVAWISPLFTPWCGPLVAREHEGDNPAAEKLRREGLEALARLVRASVPRAGIILPPRWDDARGLAWGGWKLRLHYTMTSRWEAEGAWRDDVEGPARRQARKASDAGIHAVVLEVRQTEALCRLWNSTAARQGLEASLATSLARLGAWLGTEANGFVIEARDSTGNAQAAALIGWDDARVYYLAGASDADALGSGAPTLLHLAVLEEIDRRGLPRCYDWVGGNNEGVARFKRRLGARPEALAAGEWRSRWARMLELLRHA